MVIEEEEEEDKEEKLSKILEERKKRSKMLSTLKKAEVIVSLPKPQVVEQQEQGVKQNISIDGDNFDMFSDNVDQKINDVEIIVKESKFQDDWDDEAGFYILRTGELYNDRYRVNSEIIQGDWTIWERSV